MERLSSHTSSDDHKLYRTAEELAGMEKCDPLKCWKDSLIADGILTEDEFAKILEDLERGSKTTRNRMP